MGWLNNMTLKAACNAVLRVVDSCTDDQLIDHYERLQVQLFKCDPSMHQLVAGTIISVTQELLNRGRKDVLDDEHITIAAEISSINALAARV